MESEAVQSVALESTSLAAWAQANAPEWFTLQQQQNYVDLFLLAADIYQEWDAAGEGAGLIELFDIDEEDEGYGGDAEGDAGGRRRRERVTAVASACARLCAASVLFCYSMLVLGEWRGEGGLEKYDFD